MVHSDEFERKIRTAIGAATKQKRKALGLTQEALSLKSGLHRAYIGDIERGARNPTLVNMVKIANGLSITLGELCGSMEVICKKVSSGPGTRSPKSPSSTQKSITLKNRS